MSDEPPVWIVTYLGHPVRFVENLNWNVWAVCHLSEATTFTDPDTAYVKLVDWNLRGNGKFAVRKNSQKP